MYLIEIFIHEIRLLIKGEHDLALACQFIAYISFRQACSCRFTQTFHRHFQSQNVSPGTTCLFELGILDGMRRQPACLCFPEEKAR